MEKKQKMTEVIQDEERILNNVVHHLSNRRGTGIHSGYDEDMLELRDAIAEALPEDLPSLVEQMTRLQALAAQRGQGNEVPVDPASPYFGHMRLREQDDTRDVLLGKRTYLSAHDNIRIVDWRNAPVSRMYYCYEEGDEYEETFGGKYRNGIVESRRSVTVLQGQLRRIDCPAGTFVRKGEQWITLDRAEARLSGGQGSAVRRGKGGRLGGEPRGGERHDRHLPEISALLDSEQFKLISRDDNELLVIQGSAGSGKTTVGLHRIAYLGYHKGRNIDPRRMVVIVLNEALANYVKDVVPGLGVHGVNVWTFQRWAERLRKKHVKGLPATYSEWTPSVVSRVKKHPALLRILDDLVETQDEEMENMLASAVDAYADGKRVMSAWKKLARVPLDVRRKQLLRWLDGDIRIGGDNGASVESRTALIADSALEKMGERVGDIVSDWADLFTDRPRLQRVFDIHAPAEFSAEDVDTVHKWCTDSYRRIFDAIDTESDASVEAEGGPCIDREDDAILLRLHQLKKGWLRDGGRRLEYGHLMVDEVQDFSALEVRVLLDVVGVNCPVTLAGDTAQKIVREGGFDSWDAFFDDLGLRDVRIAPLKIAYRSTVEVMNVARDVLGPIAGDEAVATRHGAPVEVHQFSDPGQAVYFLSAALREMLANEPLASVAVLARHRSQARVYYRGLKTSEIPRLRLVLDQDFTFTPGVDVTTIQQVKGLEFDYVIIVDCNADAFSLSNEARHLLHVGMTRAAHQLWVVTTGQPSPLIPDYLL